MPKPVKKDKPSTRAPVGDGMIQKAREWILGRQGKVDAKVESAQRGSKTKTHVKRTEPIKMSMGDKTKAARIEQAVQEAKDREMDKNMAKGYAGAMSKAVPTEPNDPAYKKKAKK